MRSTKLLMLSIGVLIAGATGGCSPRQVEVRSTPSTPSAEAPVLRVSNNLSQGVNVYVTVGGSEMFVKQVAANSTEQVPVQGVTSGSTVRLRATTLDGTRSYTKNDVVLSGTYGWQLP